MSLQAMDWALRSIWAVSPTETINRNLAGLEKKGIVRSVHRQDGAGRDLSKTYSLNMAMSGMTQDHTDWTIHRGRRRS